MEFSNQGIEHQQPAFDYEPSFLNISPASSSPLRESCTIGHVEPRSMIPGDSMLPVLQTEFAFQGFDSVLEPLLKCPTSIYLPVFSAPPQTNFFGQFEPFNASNPNIVFRPPSPTEKDFTTTFGSRPEFIGNPVMNGFNGSFEFQISPSEPVSRPTSAKSMPSIGRKHPRKASNTPPGHRRSLPGTILHKRVEDPLGHFKCSCNMIFKGEKKKSARNNLQRHIEEKNNSKRWACIYRDRGCEHRGARKSNARQHMKNCRKGNAGNTSSQQPLGEPIDTWQP